MNEIQEPKRIDDIEKLSDKFKPIVIRLLADIELLKYPLKIFETLRTAERQNYLFKKGASKCDGYIHLGNHQSGNAIDLVPFINNQFTWDVTKYNLLLGKYCAGKYPMIRWGHTFKFADDMWHFELNGGLLV